MISNLIQRFRGYLSLLGLVVRTSEEAADSASPSITAGSAAPDAAEPNGSFYLRTNGQVYHRTGGAWVELSSIVTGSLTVTNGTNSGTASVGAAYNGKPVVAMLNGQDGSIYVVGASIASGTLTVGLSGNVTANRAVGYVIGR